MVQTDYFANAYVSAVDAILPRHKCNETNGKQFKQVWELFLYYFQI